MPLLAAVIGLAGSFWCAAPAAACSYAPVDPRLQGTPANGEDAVPTNVVPVYRVPYDFGALVPSGDPGQTVPGDFVLETAAGAPIGIHVRLAYVSHVEIVPDSPLSPNTAYRVRATWQRTTGESFSDALEFTTGAGPREGLVPPPMAAITHLECMPKERSSCDPELERTCVSVRDAGAYVEAAPVDELGQVSRDRYLQQGPFFFSNLNPDTQTQTNFRCMQLRARAADGVLSEPTMVCGEGAAVKKVAGCEPITCGTEGLNIPPGAEVQSGCSAAPVGRGSPLAWLWLLPALWLRASRRSQHPRARDAIESKLPLC